MKKGRDKVVLGLRLDPALIQAVKVYTLRLGRGWTTSRLVETLLRREMGKKAA